MVQQMQVTLLVRWLTLSGCIYFVSSFGIPSFLEIGGCAKPALKADFDVNKYAGLWFDIENVPNEYQYTRQCVTQTYTWTSSVMQVATRGLNEKGDKVKQLAYMHEESSREPSPNPAHMTVDAKGVPAAPYMIIDTDYTNYSCVYSCMNFMGFRAEFFWIFGRTPHMTEAEREICKNHFVGIGADPKKLKVIRQGEDCPYWSKIDDLLAPINKVIASEKTAIEKTQEKTTTAIKKSTNETKVEISEAAKETSDLQHSIVEEVESDLRSDIERTEGELATLKHELEDDILELKHEVQLIEREEHQWGASRAGRVNSLSEPSLSGSTTVISATALILLATVTVAGII